MKQIYTVALVFIFLHVFSISPANELFPARDVPSTDIRLTESEKLILIRKMYPNPVKDKLTIEIWLKTEGEIKTSIYDITGNLIMNKSIVVGYSGENKIAIDLSGLRPGIYILKTEKGKDAVSLRLRKQ